MERSRPGHIPLLVSFYRQTLDNVQPEIHDGTYAMQLRPPIRYADISSEVDAGPATQSALNSTQIWCEEAYFSCDERLPVEPGTHLLVYTPDEGGQTEENHEEEAATSDESMDLPDDRSSTLQRRSWTLWTIVVSWTAAAISTSPHEWHRSVISVVLQGTIYFALSPLNWQSHVSDRWCSVNLMVGDAIRCRTSEDLYWTNDTQRADRRDLPLVDLSCSSRICTRPPRNDEVQVPATLDRCRHETVRRPILFEAASHGGSSDGCGLTSRPSGISPKRDAIYFNSFDGGRKLLGRCSGQPCVYLMWATFFFLHPCHQLSPPGNGRPISLVNLLRRDEGGSNHTSPEQEFTVVDIRTTSHLEYLDDFCILGRKVLVFDVAPCDDKVNFSIPFTFDDAMELLQPWPLGAFCDDFAVFDEMHPVGQAFLDASVPYGPETLVSGHLCGWQHCST